MKKDVEKKTKLKDISELKKKESIREKALLLGDDEVIAKAIQNLLRKDTLH